MIRKTKNLENRCYNWLGILNCHLKTFSLSQIWFLLGTLIELFQFNDTEGAYLCKYLKMIWFWYLITTWDGYFVPPCPLNSWIQCLFLSTNTKTQKCCKRNVCVHLKNKIPTLHFVKTHFIKYLKRTDKVLEFT